MRRFVSILAAAMLTAAIPLSSVIASTTVTTPNGTWTAHPGQSTTYGAAVQQPINTDGSSNFKANGKAVIPVKFALSQGTGGFLFQSVLSDTSTANDYSYLNFNPTTNPDLSDVTGLFATYAFTDGDCAGGSLRWTLYLDDGGVTRNLDVHYQPGTDSISQQTCAANTSGTNRADLGSSDPYVVIQEFTGGHTFPLDESYNVTWAEAVAELGDLEVLGMNLIVDSGWGANGDQVIDLTSAAVQVGGSTGYTDTFTPQPGSATTTVCPSAQASIKITKTDGLPSGDVNEPISVQPQDNNGLFRIVDCKYMYNLATSSLSGVGTYTVYATIGSTTFVVGAFDLK
jgi:hypothetical protein